MAPSELPVFRLRPPTSPHSLAKALTRAQLVATRLVPPTSPLPWDSLSPPPSQPLLPSFTHNFASRCEALLRSAFVVGQYEVRPIGHGDHWSHRRSTSCEAGTGPHPVSAALASGLLGALCGRLRGGPPKIHLCPCPWSLTGRVFGRRIFADAIQDQFTDYPGGPEIR